MDLFVFLVHSQSIAKDCVDLLFIEFLELFKEPVQRKLTLNIVFLYLDSHLGMRGRYQKHIIKLTIVHLLVGQ
jgi:hypothetical protein